MSDTLHMPRRLTRRATAASGAGGIRPDIQALRAIAVVAVLLYHLWPHRLTGGYIGVDVFFVISGFLITSHLLREFESTGSVRVAQFWARRARRLLPASLLVLLATVIATIVFVPLSLWDRFLGEITASTLYVQNWFLAAMSVDYLGADADPSPVQHFWTLSVEEQFYVALPLLILLVAWLARRRQMAPRRLLLAVVVAITALSFVYGLVYTFRSDAAYFSTATRAWEFGVGALIAFAPAVVRRSGLLTTAGILAVAVSAVVMTSQTPFPGYAALLPVLGAAVAIWASAGTWLSLVGRSAPVALLGRTSYAIYLWHWPLIVIVPYATGMDLSTWQKLAILVASVGLAWLSTTYWEDPMRFSRLVAGRRPRVTAAWSVVGMLIVLGAVGGAHALHDSRERAQAAAAETAESEARSDGCFGAEAMVDRDCEKDSVTSFTPPLTELAADDDNRADCWAGGSTGSGFRSCVIGPEQGYSEHFLVLGDSHSNTLIGVYEELARDHGWRFDVAGHAGCYPTTRSLSARDAAGIESCDAWRAEAIAQIANADVDGIIVTRSTTSSRAQPIDGETATEAEVAGMKEAWNARQDNSIPIIVIRDNPALGKEAFECLESVGTEGAASCAVHRDTALRPDLQVDAALGTDNAHVIDLSEFYCSGDVCPAVIGGVVVYRPDGHHLSATYAETLEPYLFDDLNRISDETERGDR